MNRRKINYYIYVLAVSKRARQLLKGAKPLIPYKEFNAIKIAKEEIDRGLVIPIIPSEVMEKIEAEEVQETAE